MQYFHGMSHRSSSLRFSSMYVYLQALPRPQRAHSPLRRPSAIPRASGLVNSSGLTCLKAAATVVRVGCLCKASKTPMPRYSIPFIPHRLLIFWSAREGERAILVSIGGIGNFMVSNPSPRVPGGNTQRHAMVPARCLASAIYISQIPPTNFDRLEAFNSVY